MQVNRDEYKDGIYLVSKISKPTRLCRVQNSFKYGGPCYMTYLHRVRKRVITFPNGMAWQSPTVFLFAIFL